MENNQTKEAFDQLYNIIARLRGPGGCPWDIEQSPHTLRPNLLEEMYECIDAINNRDDKNLREELGDLYLIITMISYMKEEEGSFSTQHVLQEISEKLIRRHPHVFGESQAKSLPDILQQWENIKEHVEGKYKEEHLLDHVPASFPPLERALKIQKTVSKVGFDWEKIDDIWLKLEEEIWEIKEAIEHKNKPEIEEEMGDILFTVVNLCRFLKVNPTIALESANKKFTRRFNQIEKEYKEKNMDIKKTNLEQLDQIWNEIKKREKA
jgi:tetrapyrrole methylase family protein/MazG family protein